MSSVDIYTILSSKPHNSHYLNRYWKFIQAFQYQKRLNGKTEYHHICPKSTDLFPEYKSLKMHMWNGVYLTHRQHFIAHWLLAKAYGGKQIYAFVAMCNGQKTQYQQERYNKIISKVYETMKKESSKIISSHTKGKATYRDSFGNKIHCYTNDPRVLSGELISTTKGRKMPRKNKVNYNYESIERRFPNKMIKLYFLDISITIKYYSPLLVPLLDQGWCMSITKEYKSKLATELNKKMSKESRIKAGKSISKTRSERTYPPATRTKEQRKNLRKYDDKNWINLYYDLCSMEFVEIDDLDALDYHIKVFTKNESKLIFDINGNKRFFNKKCPVIPNGYYAELPFSEVLCYNLKNSCIEKIFFKDFNEDSHVRISIPNGGRIKFYHLEYNHSIYLNKEFIETYGVPLNCRNNQFKSVS